jgi:hypothetical protein
MASYKDNTLKSTTNMQRLKHTVKRQYKSNQVMDSTNNNVTVKIKWLSDDNDNNNIIFYYHLLNY